MRFFDTPRYARQALANCLVRIGEVPVWIGDIGDDFNTTFTYLTNGRKSEIPDIRKVEDLNIEPVPLGYINLRSKAVYLRRIPRRRWKQGLSSESLDKRIGTTAICSRSMANCITGRYPSLEKALSRVKEGLLSSAFDRDWAISTGVVNPDLRYKGTVVGIINNEGLPTLSLDNQYLHECLEGVMG